MTSSRWILSLAIYVTAASACSSQPIEPQQAPLIVGEDDRHDWYEAEPLRQTRARESIAAVVPRERLSISEDGSVAVTAPTLGDAAEGRLCSSVRYLEQPSLASCSATLVDERLVVTAGHCLAVGVDCSGLAFVFDYHLTDATTLEHIDADDVFFCERVVAFENESYGHDFAFLELDRSPPATRRAVPLRSSPPAHDERLHMLGFPLGLPLKVTPGRAIHGDGAWSPLLDSFAGNSGSSLWTDDGRVAGILLGTAGGYASFVPSEEGCFVENVVEEDPSEVPGFAAPSEAMLARLCDVVGWTGALCSDRSADAGVAWDGGAGTSQRDAGPGDARPAGDAGTTAPAASGCVVGGASRGSSVPIATVGIALLLVVARRRR